VVGVTLHLWDYADDGSVQGRCCAPEDVHDARRVADKLGIAHYSFDRRELFEREVVSPFVEAYLQGQTPSPCVRCNRGVKLRELIALADAMDAARIATGHYARLDTSVDPPRLRRAADLDKDQSYFLHMLGPDVLRRLSFPLGALTKKEVRARAEALALPGAGKGESQELCFVPTGRYDAFVGDRAKDRVRPGAIVDAEGRVVGEHSGIHQFTRGQRKNLGVALGYRAHVYALDTETGTVHVGPRERLAQDRAQLGELSLRGDVRLPLDCQVVVRYRGTPAPARILPQGDGARIEFAEPVFAAVPGQYAVFYQGDEVLGGGVIQEARA
jgi:tRNA-specific 2-thiouridylase